MLYFFFSQCQHRLKLVLTGTSIPLLLVISVLYDLINFNNVFPTKNSQPCIISKLDNLINYRSNILSYLKPVW